MGQSMFTENPPTQLEPFRPSGRVFTRIKSHPTGPYLNAAPNARTTLNKSIPLTTKGTIR